MNPDYKIIKENFFVDDRFVRHKLASDKILKRINELVFPKELKQKFEEVENRMIENSKSSNPAPIETIYDSIKYQGSSLKYERNKDSLLIYFLLADGTKLSKKFTSNQAMLRSTDNQFEEIWPGIDAQLNDFEKFDKNISDTQTKIDKRDTVLFIMPEIKGEKFCYMKKNPDGLVDAPDTEEFQAFWLDGKLSRYGRFGGVNELLDPGFNTFYNNANQQDPEEFSGFITEDGNSKQFLRKSRGIEMLGQLKNFKAHGLCTLFDKLNNQFVSIDYEEGRPKMFITVDTENMKYSYIMGKYGVLKSQISPGLLSGSYKDGDMLEFGKQLDYKNQEVREGVFSQATLIDGRVQLKDRTVSGIFEQVVDTEKQILSVKVTSGNIKYSNGQEYTGEIVDYEPVSRCQSLSDFSDYQKGNIHHFMQLAGNDCYAVSLSHQFNPLHYFYMKKMMTLNNFNPQNLSPCNFLKGMILNRKKSLFFRNFRK